MVLLVMDYLVSQRLAFALALSLFVPTLLSAAPGDDQYAVAAGHYARARWELASEEFQALLAEFPDHAKSASARFYRGEALVQLGKFDAAHASFTEFLERFPDDPRARQAMFRAAETSYLAKQAETARAELTRFQERYPDDELNAYALPYLGDLALGAKQWDVARKHYEQALDKYPAGPLADDCRYSLGRALERLNERTAAEGLYAEVAGKSSGLSAEARYQLGSTQYGRGDYQAAADTLAAFAKAFPDHAWNEQARLAEGWSRYRLREFDAAKRLFSDLKNSPSYGVDARYWLGLTYKAQGDWNAAADELLAAAGAAAANPLAPTIHFHAGEAAMRAGRSKDADAQFGRVIAGFPHSEWVDACWLGRARAALAAGNYSLVDHHAAHFAEHGSQSDKRWAMNRVKADSLIARKDYAAAIDLLEVLAGEEPEPRSAAAHQLALAVAYLGANRADEALSLVENLPAEAGDELQGEVQLTRAQALVALERFGDAAPLVEARLAAEREPARLAICRAQLAICRARTGDLASAKRLYQELAASQPDADLLAATTSYLVDAARDGGDRAWSDELLGHVTTDRGGAPYAANALALRGWDEYQQGEFEQAAATLGRLLDQYPEHATAAQAALTRGQALDQSNQTDAALESFQWLLEKHPQSKLAPQALLAIARQHDRLQQDALAAEAYERLLQDYPEFADRDAALYERAWVLTELNRAEESEQAFGQLREQFPHSKLAADASFRLAERARERKEWNRAGELLEQVFAAEPSAALLEHALYAKAQLAAAQEQWDAVRPPLEQLHRDYPHSELKLLADYWLAESAYRLQDFDQANERFKKLSEQTFGRTENWVGLTNLRRAQMAARRDDWASAQQLAERLTTDFPQFEQRYETDYLLGRALAAQTKYDEARAAYRRVLQSETGGKTETAAMAQWMTGETFLHQKEYRAALREFLRLEILYAYPTWQAAAVLQAGKCQEMLGQPQQAAELYNRVVKEFPESEFAGEAAQRLKSVAGALDRSATRAPAGGSRK